MTSKRVVLISAVLVALVAVFVILPAFNVRYADGRYPLTVHVNLPSQPQLERLAYLPFFRRDLAEYVIDHVRLAPNRLLLWRISATPVPPAFP